jgi:succinate dehydrogenase / fumarate reductase, cytochrome b subunit
MLSGPKWIYGRAEAAPGFALATAPAAAKSGSAMTRDPTRPLSPHLTVWKWGPHMLVSILHRITGAGLVIGAGLFTWWLAAAASGADSYETFTAWALWPWSLIVWIGLTWALLQHTFSGLRHFVMDIGAGYELGANRFWAVATLVLSILVTAAFWAWLLYGRGA